jgi:predicted aspartyl protease
MRESSPDSTILNYDDPQGIPVVNVSINGKSYPFLFDTGAQMTCISDEVVSKEQLEVRLTNNYIIGMSGNISYTLLPSVSWVV